MHHPIPTHGPTAWASPAGKLLLVLLLLSRACCAVAASAPADEAVPTRAAASASVLQPDEARFRESKGIKRDERVEYHDTDGNPIPFDTFQARLPLAKQFKVLRRTQGQRDAQGRPTQGETTVIFSLSLAEASIEKPRYKINPGEPFPAFQLQGLDGDAVDNGTLKGRYTLVNFFFAACAPCIAELPQLNAFAQKHAAMQFLAFTFDTTEVTRRFVASHAFSWKLVPNARSLIDQVGIKVYPSFALLDPAGKLVGIRMGLDTEKDNALEMWISSINAGKALP